MEINSNLNPGRVRSVSDKAPAARPSSPVENPTEFGGSARLNQAVRSTPESRAAVVERAKGLAADPSYPPLETINRIANLLALKLSDYKE